MLVVETWLEVQAAELEEVFEKSPITIDVSVLKYATCQYRVNFCLNPNNVNHGQSDSFQAWREASVLLH
jgi:hypothetical protein